MGETGSGTSGGEGVTSGARRRRVLVLAGIFAGFVAIHSFANVESSRVDLARAGIDETAAHVWTWELSSVALWLLLLPAIGWMVAKVRPPRFPLPATIGLHALATLPLSAIHIAGMIAIRLALYAAWGERYDYGGVLDRFVYEYRKDAVAYLMLAGFMAFALWWLSRPEPRAVAPETLLVPDGNVTHRVPVDGILWAASAGNYVEIAWGQRVLLHRSTLAGLADELGPGFVRIHRSRLVRAAAVTRVETDRSGDFTVTLSDGAQLRGSRRFRANLA